MRNNLTMDKPSNLVSRTLRQLPPSALLGIWATTMAGGFVAVALVYRPSFGDSAWRIGVVTALAVAAEAYLFSLAGIRMVRLAGARWGRRGSGGAMMAVGGVGMLFYAVQIIAMVQSGAVVSLVALENFNQTGLVSGGVRQVVAASGCVLWVVFAVSAARAGADVPMRGGAEVRRVQALFATVCGIVVVLCNFELTNPFPQRSAELAESTPLIGLVRNLVMAVGGESFGGLPEVASSQNEPFYFAGDQKHPFLRPADEKIASPAFLPRAGAPDRPNVIVLFFEGLSARTMGVYDQRRAGLTPIMDLFAAENGTMRVTNYFSHTAATFRGLHGQMASCFPSHGAWENGLKYDRQALRAAHGYRTLADILKDVGYETVFFSPHVGENGLNAMLDMLGFDEVFTMEKSQELLLGNDGELRDPRYARYLTDREILGGLVEFLKRRDPSLGKPFFAGLYNIGTHATFDAPKDGVRFGAGSNPVLNNIHNLDHEFGRFLAYFKASPWVENTVLVLTADHAHYPEPAYCEIVRKDEDYQLAFCDRIPLMVHAQFLELPVEYDCGLATSLGFAPSLLHLLGIPPGPNSFLGRSVFEATPRPRLEMVAYGAQFHAIADGRIYYSGEIPQEFAQEFAQYRRYVQMFYRYEEYNLISPAEIGDGLAK